MNKIKVPEWNHFPFIGYLHYKNRYTMKIIESSCDLYLPPLNPYLGFINHANLSPAPQKKDIGVQTDPDEAMELGQQIIDKISIQEY